MNKVYLIGNLGKDPETKRLDNGTNIIRFSVATSPNYSKKDEEAKPNWNTVVAFGRLAEHVGPQLKKGSRVFVEGELQRRAYDKNGETRIIHEIRADKLYQLRSAEAEKGA